MSELKVMFSGGGTGGHIYPAIAIAREFTQRHTQANIIFVGSKRGMENRLVPAAGFELLTLELTSLPRKPSLEQVRSIARAAKGMRAAVKMLRAFSPDLVVGTGGYVAGPVLMAAAVLGYPTLIHEQNAFPSLTNRLLGRFVDRVAVSHNKATSFFPRKKVTVTGNPLRPDILRVDREEARRRLGIGEKDMVLLVVGGSGGARQLNQTLCEAYRALLGLGLTIFHVTGESYYPLVRAKAQEVNSPRLLIMDYAHNMPDLLGAADLVVSRAGSMMAELAALGKPAILIPSPIAANDHQTHNALVAEKAGAAILLRDDLLNVTTLQHAVETLVKAPESLKVMAANFLTLAYPQATQAICDLMDEIITS